MELIWIPISVFAALMQAVRTAAQKTLNQSMSNMGTTYVRSLFGLPFLVMFLAAVLYVNGGGVPEFRPAFVAYCFGGAAAQVLATALLIHMFTLRSFAVGTMLTKSDILMTAIIGSAFFSERLSLIGWCALFVVLTGVMLLLGGRLGTRALRAGGTTVREVVLERATGVAFLCALMFTFSYLFIREATLLLEPGSFLWRGGWTVVVVTTMQTVVVGAWLLLKEPGVFRQIWPNRRIISFIGLTSALGSIGWFTAFALENASYVRAVAQVEGIFTLLISWLYFRESLKAIELLGIAVMIGGVLMFRLVG